jgi:magnesium chelatase family protein
MALAAVAAATLTGAVGHLVSVEVHVSNGLPGFTIAGRPDAPCANRGTGCVPPCSRVACPGPCDGSRSAAARARYTRRLSAPLLDRFDLVVPLSRSDPDQLLSEERSTPSAAVADRVAAARRIAAARSGLDTAPLRPEAATLLAAKLRTGELSARGLHKVAAVARTVADLLGAEQVSEAHVADALWLRAARSTVAS